MFGVRLDSIIIDGKNIHANVPRYERKMLNGNEEVKKGIGGPRRMIHESVSGGGFRVDRDGFSYSRAMDAKGGRKKEPRR